MEFRIYVGNLPYSTTQEELSNLFGAHGEVTDATIIQDGQGRSKGFGFVTMGAEDAMNAAIEALNGTELGGRTLVVNKARPKESRPARDNDNYSR